MEFHTHDKKPKTDVLDVIPITPIYLTPLTIPAALSPQRVHCAANSSADALPITASFLYTLAVSSV